MRKSWLFLLGLLAFLTGCVPVDSLSPLYTDNNVIFEPALLGRWTTPAESNAVVRFDRAEDNAYQMVVLEKQGSDGPKETVCEAHLVSLGGEKYLDVVAKELEASTQQFLFQMDSAKKGSRFAPTLERIGSGVYLEILGPTPGRGTLQELHVKLRAAHWIYKVELYEKSMSLSYLDDEWVRKAIEKKAIQASHIKARNNNQIDWVLTGSTAELQQLVVHAADSPGAFSGGMAFGKLE